jgi:hypothetical protein
MILAEKLIETAIRAALRVSITAAAAATPELATCKIIGFWLDSEDGTAAGNDADGIHVYLCAHPNSAEGYMPGVGLEPLRKMSIDVYCVTQPDNDTDRNICGELYGAVRGVFEAATPAITWPTGISFGGILITNGGSAAIEGYGQITSFTAELNISIT